MKEEDQDLLILSEYLNGELNEKDSQALEDRLDKEPHLLALFLELNEIQMASIEAAEPGLRNMVAQASDEFHQSAKPAKAPWLKWMAVAAGILLLTTIGYILLQPSSTPDLSELYVQHFVPMDNLESTSGSNSQAGFAAYDAKDYEQAAELFNRTDPADSLYHRIQVYRAISNLQIGKTSEAIRILESHLGAEPSPSQTEFYIESRWYLAMAHLKTGHGPDAIEQLQALLAVPDANHSEAAREILSALAD